MSCVWELLNKRIYDDDDDDDDSKKRIRAHNLAAVAGIVSLVEIPVWI